jgi:hypothetical protein
MKYFLIAGVLLAAACSDMRSAPGALQELSPGTIESVQPVDAAPSEPERYEAEPASGEQLVVRLNDGRTVYLVYSGPRQFRAGQAVRVHLSDSSIFLL